MLGPGDMVLRLQPASRAQLAAPRRHLALERCRVVVQAAQASAPAQRPKQPGAEPPCAPLTFAGNREVAKVNTATVRHAGAAAPTAWHAKRQLLQAIEGTERGGEATLRTRGEVEEAQASRAAALCIVTVS